MKDLALVLNSQVKILCVICTNSDPSKPLFYAIYHQLILPFFIHYYITTSTRVSEDLPYGVTLAPAVFSVINR